MRDNKLDKAYEAMGKYNEKMYMPIIKAELGNLIKSENKYDSIDFYGVDYMLELKSRCIYSNTFKETMVGYNKIIRAIETLEHYSHHIPNYKVYFAFAFKDGLFIWEYNSKTYEENGGDIQKRIGGTSKRGWNDYKDHLYIKISNLRKINDNPVWIHPLVENNYNQPSNEYKSSIPDEVCFLTFKKG